MKQLAQIARDIELRGEAKSYVRWCQALMLAKGDVMQAIAAFKSRNPRSVHLELIEKTAVSAGSTASGNWDALSPLTQLSSAFIDALRPRTVLGKLIGVRQVPFQVKTPRATTGSSVGWVGQGKPIPVARLTFDDVTLGQAKLAGIVVFSAELARSSDPAATTIIGNDLGNAIIAFSDSALLDPTAVEVADVSPASITYGATEIPSTGVNTSAIDSNLRSALDALADNGIGFIAPYWIVSPWTALILASLRGTGGERSYPGVSVLGGELQGIPVIVSAAANANIVLVDAAELMLADAGLAVDASAEAMVQMDDAPDSPPNASTVLVSLWQGNMSGLRAIRYLRWALRRSKAVAYVSGFAGGSGT